MAGMAVPDPIEAEDINNLLDIGNYRFALNWNNEDLWVEHIDDEVGIPYGALAEFIVDGEHHEEQAAMRAQLGERLALNPYAMAEHDPFDDWADFEVDDETHRVQDEVQVEHELFHADFHHLLNEPTRRLRPLRRLHRIGQEPPVPPFIADDENHEEEDTIQAQLGERMAFNPYAMPEQDPFDDLADFEGDDETHGVQDEVQIEHELFHADLNHLLNEPTRRLRPLRRLRRNGQGQPAPPPHQDGRDDFQHLPLFLAPFDEDRHPDNDDGAIAF